MSLRRRRRHSRRRRRPRRRGSHRSAQTPGAAAAAAARGCSKRRGAGDQTLATWEVGASQTGRPVGSAGERQRQDLALPEAPVAAAAAQQEALVPVARKRSSECRSHQRPLVCASASLEPLGSGRSGRGVVVESLESPAWLPTFGVWVGRPYPPTPRSPVATVVVRSIPSASAVTPRRPAPLRAPPAHPLPRCLHRAGGPWLRPSCLL